MFWECKLQLLLLTKEQRNIDFFKKIYSTCKKSQSVMLKYISGNTVLLYEKKWE